MPTYLYCILIPESGDPAPVAAHGVGGGAVRVLSTGALEAWVSTVATRSPPATVGAVREHDGVITVALATGRTPLPARFGQIWPSDVDCLAALERRSAELEPLLRQIAGLVEMTVCTLLPGMPPSERPRAARDVTAPGPGRAYLQRLRARADREQHLRLALEALRARVSRALGPIPRGEIAEIRGSDDALALSISYLVERGDESAFRAAIDEVSRESAARLVVIGPRAPYSFTSGGQPDPAGDPSPGSGSDQS